LKSFSAKKPNKDEREKQVLLGLVELYLKTGKPVGSQTLKESGFDALSPATLRNYFVKLEESGFLKQQHSSGGRIPTSLAYKTYAESIYLDAHLSEKELKQISHLLSKETREVHMYLQRAAEVLSDMTQGAVFLSTPRFDQDLLLDIKLVSIDSHRVLCILITDFGVVRTELLFADKKLSSFSIKRIEQFFHWKMTGLDKPKLSEEEEVIGMKFYNEIMLRHIVHYSSFSHSEILKTGFSKMLQYPDFNDASSLASGLSLFENDTSLRSLLATCCEKKQIQFWIGEELCSFNGGAHACSVLSIPYSIQGTIVGGLALLCPTRAPYRSLFATLKAASEVISNSLTQSLAKFAISYRKPNVAEIRYSSAQSQGFLLEDQTHKDR
jgi:heat-inducible transcriptional repressor